MKRIPAVACYAPPPWRRRSRIAVACLDRGVRLSLSLGGPLRRILLALIVLALVPTLKAEHPLKLDAPIRGEFRITNPRLLRPCDSGAVVAQIGHTLNVAVGFENTPDCWLTLRGYPGSNADGSEDLRGMSPRQAFDYLMTFMPAFSWRAMDGAIVVRPKTAWNDPRNVLNLPTAAFETTNQRLDDVVHTLLEAVTPKAFVPHEDLPKPERPIDRRVTVVFRGGTMLEAVNAVARARTDVYWQLAYSSVPGQATIEFGTLDVPGGSIILAPVAVPVGTRRTSLAHGR